MPLDIGVMLVVLHNTGKLPELIRPRNILDNLRVKKRTILFKNEGKILCGNKPPRGSGSYNSILSQRV